jgi:uncharacterized membrane protein YdjX (TVP38/TMEM64 family)
VGSRASNVPWRAIVLASILVASAVLCAVSLWRGWLRPDSIHSLVRRSGALGILVYVAGEIALELLWMPRMWGLLAAGILFGPVLGGALSVGADLLGGLLCYLIARSAGRAWLAGVLERKPRARRVVELLAERRGVLTLALLRICPVAHYTLVSYAAGLTGVRPAAFLAGTGVGLIPGAVLYPLLGNALLRPGSPMFLGLLGAVVVILAVTLWASRRLLRA